MIANKVSEWGASTRGTTAVIFALVMLFMIALVAAVLESSHATTTKQNLDNAADAAALAGIRHIMNAIENEQEPNIAEMEAIVMEVFLANFDLGDSSVGSNGSSDLESAGLSVDYSVEDGYTHTVRVDYLEDLKTIFLSRDISFSGTASASAAYMNNRAFMDVTMLLDISGSMTIGATKDDTNRMQQRSRCAFACHMSTIRSHHNAGIRLRIDAMKSATQTLLDIADETNDSWEEGNLIEMSIFTFNSRLTELVHNSTDYDYISQRLTAMPNPGSYSGTSYFIRQIARNYIENSGFGRNENDRKGFVFLVTDGVEYGGPRPETMNPRGGGRGTMNPAACQEVKDSGAIMAVVYTEYVNYGEGNYRASHFNHYVGPYHHLLPQRLEECASDGFFFMASNEDELHAAMVEMFEKALIVTDEIRLIH